MKLILQHCVTVAVIVVVAVVVVSFSCQVVCFIFLHFPTDRMKIQIVGVIVI